MSTPPDPAERPGATPLHWCNPLVEHDFADPFVWHDGARYCAIGTGRGDPLGRDAATGVFPLMISDDLVHWRDAGRALAPPDPALGDTCWAPEVAFADGRWYLYYSVGFGDRRHHLRVAVADAPLGPYVDAGALTDPDAVPFAIDAHPFRDDDGRWYLFHSRDFLDLGPEGAAPRAGTALVVQPLETMTRLAPGPVVTVARASRDWQRFLADRTMYGAVHDWHTLEGPFVVHEGGRYWCLYSGGNWQNASYGVDFVEADHVLGPWRDTGGGGGPRVLRTVPGRVIGPGHCSVVTRIGEPASRPGARMLVYHAWDTGGRARRMCMDPLRIGPDGPQASGPSWEAQTL